MNNKIKFAPHVIPLPAARVASSMTGARAAFRGGLLALCCCTVAAGAFAQDTVHYTAAERGRLTQCVGLTDTAFSIADRKLHGDSAGTVRAYYQAHPNPGLTVPLVDKVYSENFTHSWDYAVSFYGECAANLASMPTQRSQMAAYCMQNGMIAGLAQQYRETGASKERAYAHFAGMGDTPKRIIDKIYTQTSPRAQAILDEWNSCIAPLSDG